MRNRLLFAAVLVSPFVGVACSSESPEGASPQRKNEIPDGGDSPEDGRVDAYGDALACTELLANGPPVTQAMTAARDAVPPPTGGTIADGTYELTSAIVYGGDATIDESSLWVFDGALLDQASRSTAPGAAQRFRARWSIGTDPRGRKTLQWSCVCASEGSTCNSPNESVAGRLYTFDGDALVYFNDDPSDPTITSVLVRTFRRRR